MWQSDNGAEGKERSGMVFGGHMSKLELQEQRVQVKELEVNERVRQRLGWELHSWDFVLLQTGNCGKAFSCSNCHFK